MNSGKPNTKVTEGKRSLLLVFISGFIIGMVIIGGVYCLANRNVAAEPATPAPEALVEPTGTVEQPVPTAEPTRAGPVNIHWWHIQTASVPKAIWQKLADEYMAAHPRVTFEIRTPYSEPYTDMVETAMQSGDPPDIFQSWGGDRMIQYAKAGYLKDITADLDADGGAWRNTFGQGALGVYAFKDRNYGVPWDIGMVGFWYNKALFAKAGITAAPTTWTEFNADVDLLKAAGIVPIAIGEGDKWPGMHLWAYLVTRLGGKSNFENAYLRAGSFADPPFVKAGEMLRALVAKDPFQEGFLEATYGDEAAAMGNGQAAMELMGQWAPAVMKDNSDDKNGIGEDLGWFPFPAVEGGAGDPNDVLGGGNGFAIGKNAPPEAVDFVKYLTRAESLRQCAEQRWCIPPVRGGEAGLSDPFMITIQRTVLKAEYIQLYYDQALPRATGSVVEDRVYGIFAGTMTPEQAAQAIEDSAQRELG